MSTKNFIFFAISVLLLVLTNVIGTFTNQSCNSESFRIAGSACWYINYYSRLRLESKDESGSFIDFKIPYFIYEEKNKKNGAHSVIVMNLSIESKSKNSKGFIHDSFVTLNYNRSKVGIDPIVRAFENKNNYNLISTTGDFNIYQNYPVASSFKYYVPNKVKGRQLYLRCDYLCNLYGGYRNVYYVFSIPYEWIDDAENIQLLFEKYLDSIIVKN